jgi:hypothetical protein
MSFPRALNDTEKAVLMRVFEVTGAAELDVPSPASRRRNRDLSVRLLVPERELGG